MYKPYAGLYYFIRTDDPLRLSVFRCSHDDGGTVRLGSARTLAEAQRFVEDDYE